MIVRFNYLVEFTPDCVSHLERINRSRFTADTVHCLFAIGDCSIEYRSLNFVIKNFRVNFNNINSSEGVPSIAVLIVKQVFIIDRDQVTLLKQFPFIYNFN